MNDDEDGVTTAKNCRGYSTLDGNNYTNRQNGNGVIDDAADDDKTSHTIRPNIIDRVSIASETNQGMSYTQY